MITVGTLIRFLCFDANAIRTIAASKLATWIGLLFVLSAGFAREYDGEYLVAEPWHLLIPVAASLIGCAMLFFFVHLLARCRKVNVGSLKSFRSLLNVYWMTAPLAWVYAIPFERIFDPGMATRANLMLLGIVAIWRVALTVRCVQVIYKTSCFAAFVPVILFSDILAMLALALVPAPVFAIMGGVRLSESEQIILNLRFLLTLVGYGSFLIWVACYVYLCGGGTDEETDPDRWRFFSEDSNVTAMKASRGLWGLVVVSLLFWIPILFFTQPEQRLRWQSEKLIRLNDFEAFAQLTNSYPESDFSPHWDPPPRIGYGEREPIPELAICELDKYEAAEWIMDRYVVKLLASNRYSGRPDRLEDLTDEQLKRFTQVLANHIDGPEIVARVYRNDYVDVEEPEASQERSKILAELSEIGEKWTDARH